MDRGGPRRCRRPLRVRAGRGTGRGRRPPRSPPPAPTPRPPRAAPPPAPPPPPPPPAGGEGGRGGGGLWGGVPRERAGAPAGARRHPGAPHAPGAATVGHGG